MSGDLGRLPEGLDESDVKSHAVNLSIAGTLINLSGAYLTAEEGTTADAVAESALEEYIERVVGLGPEVAGGVLLVLASLVTQTGDEARVQGWFDEQGDHITAALKAGESGD